MARMNRWSVWRVLPPGDRRSCWLVLKAGGAGEEDFV